MNDLYLKMLRYFKDEDGNLITEGIIIHQVNCQGKFNAGFAKAIRNTYYKVYTDYKMMIKEFNKEELFGSIVITKIHNKLIVASIFTQFDYGRDKSIVYTDYKKFNDCIKKLGEEFKGHSFYVPKVIGCGLANGDERIIKCILSKYLHSYKFIKK